MKVFLNDPIKETPDNAVTMQSRELKSELPNVRTFKQLKKDWEKFKSMYLRG